jgi:hypothetical protein
MPHYHVTLPGTIPRRLFDNLDGIRDSEGKIYDCIVRSLDNDYRDIEKDTYSHGATSLDALSNVFIRDLRDNHRSARSMIKMFRPVVNDYVGEEVQQVQPEPQPQPQPVQNQPLEQRAAPEQLDLFR